VLDAAALAVAAAELAAAGDLSSCWHSSVESQAADCLLLLLLKLPAAGGLQALYTRTQAEILVSRILIHLPHPAAAAAAAVAAAGFGCRLAYCCHAFHPEHPASPVTHLLLLLHLARPSLPATLHCLRDLSALAYAHAAAAAAALGAAAAAQ
jgi:hypothetical protein